MFLLDTNVISELRKPQADKNVQAWARSVPAPSLYVSAITVLELETGVLRFERKDPVQGSRLRAWLDNHVMPTFAGRDSRSRPRRGASLRASSCSRSQQRMRCVDCRHRAGPRVDRGDAQRDGFPEQRRGAAQPLVKLTSRRTRNLPPGRQAQ